MILSPVISEGFFQPGVFEPSTAHLKCAAANDFFIKIDQADEFKHKTSFIFDSRVIIFCYTRGLLLWNQIAH